MAVYPPPVQDPMNSQAWLEWFRRVNLQLDEIGAVSWSNIIFAGSDITDIAARAHNNLQTIDGGTGGQYYHLTSAQHSNLTGNSIQFPSYTVAGVPSASTEGAGSMIYVSNESGGAVMAFSDGTNWRRVTDRNIIS